MELRHFRYVVAVGETLHFGRAAERLNISQPPLSQQIRQVEEELGVQLFHRTKRQVQLTEAGRIFMDEARIILACAERAGSLAARVSHGEVGQLTIGVIGPADANIIVEIFRRFAKRHPRVRVILRNLNTAQQTQAIREGRLHVGFLAPPVDDAALAVETVVRFPIFVALPRNHPLASQPFVQLRAMATEPHVSFSRDAAPGLFDSIMSGCRVAGFTPRIAHEVDNLYSACSLVAAGLGVAFVPAGIQHVRPIVLRPLRPALSGVEANVAVAYRRDSSSELLELFLNVVREVAAPNRRGVKRNRRGMKG
jgi:DNA-binding transcriptional LysR family regulator